MHTVTCLNDDIDKVPRADRYESLLIYKAYNCYKRCFLNSLKHCGCYANHRLW